MLDLGVLQPISALPCLASWRSVWCDNLSALQEVQSSYVEDELMWDQLVAPWKANRPTSSVSQWAVLNVVHRLSRAVGIYEILLSPDMCLRPSAMAPDVAKLRDLAYREGMKPLRISGAFTVAAELPRWPR